jgi:signal transduction histidine kinase/ActR/RegA family two-component response regulator/HAMP domain-containing protein
VIAAIRGFPIRQKVALLIAAALVAGLLFAGGAVVVYELTTYRPRVLADARTQADLIRVNSVAALQFDDREAAAENLATARQRPEILAVALHRADGRIEARYMVPGGPPPPTDLKPGAWFLPGRLLLIDRIVVDSQPLGWLSLSYAVPSLWQRLPGYGIMALVVLLALGTAGALLLGMLGRSVSAPLLVLTGAAREITRTGSYRLRVPDRAGDEIGELTAAFNRMVATVEQQQDALHQSEARLRLALAGARMTTWVLDLAAGAEPAITALLGGVHPDHHVAVAEAIRAAIADRSGFEVEFRIARDGETEHWTALRGQLVTDERGQPARLIGVAQDVTDQRRIAQQLIQSQRMEAIGNLAGGIAHDFNNLLTGMLGYLAFVQRRLPPDPQLREDLAQVDRAARRAAALTSQLLSYARRQMVIPTVVDLNATITSLEPLMRRVVGEDLELATELADGLGATRVDPGQLEQVLLNLVANARDAMPQGGRLTIRTRRAVINDEAARLDAELRPGEYVVTEVGDTGIGMTPEVMARVFEPFFTTKPPGSGTGLGLAMCYGIVKQADGHIAVESEPGRGSRFSVFLPRQAEPVPATDGSAAPAPPRGRETVLLVEDDETVRELTARFLRESGYTVLQASDAAAARDCFERHRGGIDLLLTDVVMPGGSGRELAETLAAREPSLAIVYMSGYTADIVLRQGVVQEAVAFIPKPFTESALGEAVRQALDARSPARSRPS